MPKVVKPVLVVFADGPAFFKSYRALGDSAALVIKRDDLAEGDDIEIEIAFVQGAMVFHARGRVVERSALLPGRSGGSALVELVDDDKLRELLVSYARGERDPKLRKRARRIPLRVAVEFTDAREFRSGVTVDVSHQGAAIATSGPVPNGGLLALRFTHPDGSLVTVNAELVWRRPEPGTFGVRFLIADDVKGKQVAALVDALVRAAGL